MSSHNAGSIARDQEDSSTQDVLEIRSEGAISRRSFLGGMTALCGAAALGNAALPVDSGAALPNPGSSGIEHIVLVMMENRSFDHFLGWLPMRTDAKPG